MNCIKRHASPCRTKHTKKHHKEGTPPNDERGNCQPSLTGCFLCMPGGHACHAKPTFGFITIFACKQMTADLYSSCNHQKQVNSLHSDTPYASPCTHTKPLRSIIVWQARNPSQIAHFIVTLPAGCWAANVVGLGSAVRLLMVHKIPQQYLAIITT